MDSRFIEVAIGLALVFALSSLLVSAVQELWASYAGTRGKYMLEAMTSFLGDDRELAASLLQQPLLKSLALTLGKQKRHPSYVSADMFVTALLAHLSKQYAGGIRPSTPLELLTRAGSAMNPALSEAMQALMAGAEHDWPLYQQRLGAWFDAVGERSIGWFKRNTQRSLFIIGLGVAALLNLNPVVIADALWNDAALRALVADQAEAALKIYESEKAQGARTGMPDKTAPAASAPAPLPAADAPDARQVEAKLAYISEVLAAQSAAQRGTSKLPKNAERIIAAQEATAHVEQTLDDERASVRKSAREASHALERTNSAVDRLRQSVRTLTGNGTGGAAKGRQDAPGSAPAEALDPASPRTVGVADVDQLATLLNEERARRDRPAGSADPGARACTLADPAAQQLCERFDALNLGLRGLPIGWSGHAWPRVFKVPASVCPQSMGAAAASTPAGLMTKASGGSNPQAIRPAPGMVPGDADNRSGVELCLALDTGGGWLNLLVAVMGWVLVALASTFGAPFWFDALGKLVKLRGSGPPQGAGTTGVGADANARARVDASAPAPAAGAVPAVAGVEPQASSDAMSAAELALTPSEIEALQRQLGMPAMQWSGRLDLNMRDAIRRWQQGRGERADGILTSSQVAVLNAQTGGTPDDGFMG